jgi:hypothetical protein
MSFLSNVRLPVIGSDTNRVNERLITIVHKHWFALFREVLGVVVLFFAPFIAIPVIAGFVGQSAQAAELGAVLGFLGALWALICWHILFTKWTDYYFDVWIITNWRIIDFDLKGLFNVDIATVLDLDHIQDIQTETAGIVGNILNFGMLNVQTAATKRELSFDDCPGPTHVERIIRSAQEELIGIKHRQEQLVRSV